ncbi:MULTISPECIES: hypothetical protein [Corynebacterium]|uniref:hypothetical protein n=1 Tax=Corynebacterium TaxID=1716 RepID=UPI00254FA1BE|nr:MULTISPECIES: hypothetical protein [Corynebacterium]MDK6259894.1 hypothetical protein [Corynebacterium frankenforstense]MDK8895318.1 hypothetical protein [Corynebacterium sp. MSK006]
MKNMTVIGVAFGLAVALAAILGGLSGFVCALLFGALGGVVGAHFEGLIDLRNITDAFRTGRGGRG